MNKKLALGLTIIALAVILLVKQLFFATSLPTQVKEKAPIINMQEILKLVESKEKPILIHIYALNPNCPNCDVEFIETELVKVAELEKTFGNSIKVIRINIFDYPQDDIAQLATRLELSQAPTTIVISQQEIIGKEIGSISLAKTQLLLEEAANFDSIPN